MLVTTYSSRKDPRPYEQSVNNILHIITWCHSSVVNHGQMRQCHCHVNNVFQSIICGYVVMTACVMSHGRRLKVSYDLSWITDRPSNLSGVDDTPHCIWKYSFRVPIWVESAWGRRYYPRLLLLTFISLLWLVSHMPIVFSLKPNFSFISFHLLTNFISLDKTTMDGQAVKLSV